MSDTYLHQNAWGHLQSQPNFHHLDEIRNQVIDLIEQATGQRQVILAHTLIVDFFDRDHNAAILFNQILYWTARTNDPDGWFYKTYDHWYQEIRFSAYQVWRVVRGDPRVQQAKRTLWSIGLETQVRMAPNGRNAVHYRLNIPAFMTAFTEWLSQLFPTRSSTQTTPDHIKPLHSNQRKSQKNLFHQHQRALGRATSKHRRTIWQCQQILGKKKTAEIIEQVAAWSTNWEDVCNALHQHVIEQSSGTVVPLSSLNMASDNGTVVPLHQDDLT